MCPKEICRTIIYTKVRKNREAKMCFTGKYRYGYKLTVLSISMLSFYDIS